MVASDIRGCKIRPWLWFVTSKFEGVFEVVEKLSVLLVEDDVNDVEAVQRAFKTVQPAIFELVHVPRFLDAIQKLRTESFQVVILDLGLPDSVGLNGVQRLMKMIPTVPVIVLTGVDDEVTALKGIELGAQEVLDKNRVSPRDLVRTIRHATKRKQHWIASLAEHKNLISGSASQSDLGSALGLDGLVALDALSATLKETSGLVLSKTDVLMKTELSESQRAIVSDISKSTQQSMDSLDAFRLKLPTSDSATDQASTLKSTETTDDKAEARGASELFKPLSDDDPK